MLQNLQLCWWLNFFSGTAQLGLHSSVVDYINVYLMSEDLLMIVSF